MKRGFNGAKALKRYLEAQSVPASRILITVVEPAAGVDDPLGHVELILVRSEEAGPPAAK